MGENINFWGNGNKKLKRPRPVKKIDFFPSKGSLMPSVSTKRLMFPLVKSRPPNNFPLRPSPLFKKESISQRRLSPYGDADMDGSLNKFDCDPRKVNRDGFIQDAMRFISRGFQTKSQRLRSDLQASKAAKLRSKIYESNIALNEARQAAQQARINESRLASKISRKQIALKQAKKIIGPEGDNSKILDQERFLDKLKARQMIERARLNKNESKSLKSQRLLERATSKLDRQNMQSQMQSAAQTQSASKRFNKTAQRLVRSLQTGRVSSGRGRPAGSLSGKYVIPGRGVVGVYEWRKWVSEQKRLARAGGTTSAYSSDIKNIQDENIRRAFERKQYPNQPASQEEEMMSTSDYQEQVQYEEPQQMPTQQYTQQYTRTIQRPQTQVVERTQIQRQMNPNQVSIRERQRQMQEQDNILKAPQFMKGELTNVGDGASMTYTPAEENILNAPNFSQGEMRNVDGDRPSVELGPKPQSNPLGDYYTDIDPVSGKELLRKRTSEKWLDGRAI